MWPLCNCIKRISSPMSGLDTSNHAIDLPLKSLKYFVLYLLRFFILHLLLIPGGCNWLENAVRSSLQISNRISQYQMSHLKTKAISCRLVFFWTGYHKWRIFVERSTHFCILKAVGMICRNVWVAAGPIINSGPPP